jgi:transglutaminase-like putative cysteine protease
VSVWCGTGVGWVDLDPTNALVVGEDHVRLAFGRDYADVAPVDGVIMASAGHTLAVSVDVAPSP